MCVYKHIYIFEKTPLLQRSAFCYLHTRPLKTQVQIIAK